MENVVSLLGRDSGDLAALGELAGDSGCPTCGPMGICYAAVRGAALAAGYALPVAGGRCRCGNVDFVLFVALVLLCRAELPPW